MKLTPSQKLPHLMGATRWITKWIVFNSCKHVSSTGRRSRSRSHLSRAGGRLVRFLVVRVGVALLLATPAAAQVRPGDVITPENAPKLEQLTCECWYINTGMVKKALFSPARLTQTD